MLHHDEWGVRIVKKECLHSLQRDVILQATLPPRFPVCRRPLRRTTVSMQREGDLWRTHCQQHNPCGSRHRRRPVKGMSHVMRLPTVMWSAVEDAADGVSGQLFITKQNQLREQAPHRMSDKECRSPPHPGLSQLAVEVGPKLLQTHLVRVAVRLFPGCLRGRSRRCCRGLGGCLLLLLPKTRRGGARVFRPLGHRVAAARRRVAAPHQRVAVAGEGKEVTVEGRTAPSVSHFLGSASPHHQGADSGRSRPRPTQRSWQRVGRCRYTRG